MNNEKAERFLDDYRRLENAAQRILGDDWRGGGNWTGKLGKRKEFSRYADVLETAREVRNVLSHEAKLDGEFLFYPSDTALRSLEKLLQKVENPPVVADVMTPLRNLVTTGMDTDLRPLMQKMVSRGVSHAPILQNGRVKGIFSIDTIFLAVLEGKEIPPDAKIGEFEKHLGIECHPGQSFRFVPAEMPLNVAEDLFDTHFHQEQKLRLLLVTENGLAGEKLLGVASPYDLLNQD